MASKKRTKRKRLNTGLLVLCVVLFVILCVLIATAVHLVEQEKAVLANIRPDVAVEAGSESVNPDAFLKTPGSSGASFVQGVTAQQLAVPGTYDVVILWNEREFASKVRVVDTVKPRAEAVPTVMMGVLPDAMTLVTEIRDVTEVTASYVQQPDLTVPGKYDVVVALRDTSGNENQITVPVTVVVDQQAPKILGVKPLVVYLGDAVSYRAGITLTDDYDKAPTLQVDSSNADLSKIGKYEIVYIAVDAAGNESRITTTLDVRAKQDGFVELDVIYAEADKLLDKIIDDGMSLREKARAIYNWARNNCGYSGHSDKSDYLQGAYVMMTKRSGDCFNYFAVTKLLLERCGIDTIDVRKVKNYTGDSDHFWSLVSLDGGQSWYHFDATPRVGEGDDFFMVTDAFLDAYSAANKNCHNRDKSLYPATPER